MKAKLKLNINNQELFKILNYILIVASLLFAFFLFKFLDKNVLHPLTVDEGNLNIKIDYSSGRIDKNKYNKLLESLDSKNKINNNNKELEDFFK